MNPPICEHCQGPILGSGKRYCSQRCHGAAVQTATMRTCARPGCPGQVLATPARLADGRGKYCSRECLYEARASRPLVEDPERGLPRVCALPGCGRTFVQRQSSRRYAQRYCSQPCGNLAQRVVVEPRSCASCSTVFTPQHGADARGWGRFCSHPCSYKGRDGQVELVCPRCERTFSVSRSVAPARRYCSANCRYGREGTGIQIVACATCGKETRQPRFLLVRGFGKYCSKPCWWVAARRQRVMIACRGCKTNFSVNPAEHRRGRMFCTNRCWRLHQRLPNFTCTACGSGFRSPPWRDPLFCSLPCSAKGQRRPSPRHTDRDRRILELRDQGLIVLAIRMTLLQERAEWTMDAAAIRKVLSRAHQPHRAAHHEQFVTLAPAAVAL